MVSRILAMPWWYALLALVVSMLALSLAGVAYTNYSLRSAQKAERENDRRWCRMLITLDDAYSSTPPQTDTGRRLAHDIHELRVALECTPS